MRLQIIFASFFLVTACNGLNLADTGDDTNQGQGLHYQIYSDENGEWRWRLRAGNNKIIASGESYHNLEDCNHAVELLKASKNAPVTVIVVTEKDQ